MIAEPPPAGPKRGSQSTAPTGSRGAQNTQIRSDAALNGARPMPRPERRFPFTLGRDVLLRRSGQASGRQLRRAAADRQAELGSSRRVTGRRTRRWRRGRRSCGERRRGAARPGERQGDDRAGLTAGIDPAAYWGHGPDHRDNHRRDPRHMACRHGCRRDRGHAQDVSHHRTDRDGRLHRRVARGQAPWSRLARRSRRGHPMPTVARRYPAGPQTPGTRLGSLPDSRLPGGDHRAGDEHGHQGHAPGGDG